MAVRPEHVSDERTNQSDTDSDSEGSTASAGQPAQGGAIVQSILRVSSCRSLKKKKSSVEFALDIDDVDEEDGKKSQQGCLATRCMPRRLTLEEKVALYQIRPDLEIVPMPFIMKELEEMRRRRQRKLMFSVLGGTLLLFMVIVLYYLLVQE
ncbi:TPA: hypothetical protein N0F65_011450 [Lagenidium giganteum]|uniref:Uncharacterized protein n=1 Tax=Lagenidium giganteum TaxID=4803 RepID=A0AAV2ZBZ3_9STRA|nr:TPA: hypothetical protein N0F65_011450 [Lagenidium giganteum]